MPISSLKGCFQYAAGRLASFENVLRDVGLNKDQASWCGENRLIKLYPARQTGRKRHGGLVRPHPISTLPCTYPRGKLMSNRKTTLDADPGTTDDSIGLFGGAVSYPTTVNHHVLSCCLCCGRSRREEDREDIELGSRTTCTGRRPWCIRGMTRCLCTAMVSHSWVFLVGFFHVDERA